MKILIYILHEVYHTLDRAGAFAGTRHGCRLPALVLAGAAALAPRQCPASIASWPFSAASDYVLSDSTKVQITGGVARLIPVDQTDDAGDPLGFGGGTHAGTEWDAVNELLKLAGAVSSGDFTSRVMDAGTASTWSEISWTPRRPYLKELPGGGAIESGYAEGNADMTGDVFLAHMNESPCAGGDSVADSSGSSNDGVLYTGEGASDKSAAGVLGGALVFDGDDDVVEVADAPELNVTDAVTVEAWIAPSAGGGTVGEISTAASAPYEFDAVQGHDPDIIHVAGDVYAIAYGQRDAGSDGWLCTVRISGDGTIAHGKIDSLMFDGNRGFYPDLARVSGDVYAIAYTGAGDDGWVATVGISEDGTIAGGPLDSYEFDSSNGEEPDILHVSGEIYAVAYSGQGSDGWLVTLRIAPDGTIYGDPIDLLEFNSTQALRPRLIRASGDIYAVAYTGQGNDGWLSTVRIEADGDIGPSTIDDLEFDSSSGEEPDIVHVSGDVFAIAYRGYGSAGRLITVSIAADGTLGPGAIDSDELDAVEAVTPDIFHVGRNVYAVAYGGPDSRGWLKTLLIEEDGTFGGFVDQLEYDPAEGTEPCAVNVSGDAYAVAYAGPGFDGFLRTFETLTERGILKTGAYGVDADTAAAHAWINGHTISAPLSSGWNHVALVYDRNAATDRQILYVNGAPAAAAATAGEIEVCAGPLVVGKRLAGRVDEVVIFSRALSPAEIADHYMRGALRVRFQVRTGSTDPPPGPFVGPDGTETDYYSELYNDVSGPPSIAITSLPAGRYFQYKVYLETYGAAAAPELEAVSIGPVHYPGDNPTVCNAAGPDYASLFSFVEAAGAANEGTAAYQISNDGSNWYYWNGSSWVGATGYSETNPAGDVAANIGEFDEDVGAGAFYFKAFLHSDAAVQQVELDRIDLGYIAAIISVAVGDPVFAFGTSPLNTWLAPDSTVIFNDGTVAEDLLGRISEFSEGVEVWGVDPVANGDDRIRAQWSTAGTAGPWIDISAYNTDFTISTNVAASDSVTLWFRIMTPTGTSSFKQYSSTLTVTAQEF